MIPERDRPVFDLLEICYHLQNSTGGGQVRQINLFEYFELAEALASARKLLSSETLNAGSAYFGLSSLEQRLKAFVDAPNGFGTCKHSAIELNGSIRSFLEEDVWPPGTQFSEVNFGNELQPWKYRHLVAKIDTFRGVFEAECHDVDVYSVGQVGIFKTRDLVANASQALPEECRNEIPDAALKEFDDAGRCLAFDLPTACGFHALRATELVIDQYLKAFGVTKSLVSWNAYIKAAQLLVAKEGRGPKPSPKVAAMLDRMRSLDRNPLMHPRDKLDRAGAVHLFNLSAITVAEMVKDIQRMRAESAIAEAGEGNNNLVELFREQAAE